MNEPLCSIFINLVKGDPFDITIQIADIKKQDHQNSHKRASYSKYFFLLILSCLLIKFNKKMKNLILKIFFIKIVYYNTHSI